MIVDVFIRGILQLGRHPSSRDPLLPRLPCLQSLLATGWLVGLLSCPCASAESSEAVRQGLWVTNGTVRTVCESGNTVYVGGDFTRVGPMPGNAVPLDAATGVPITFPQVDGTVLAILADGSGGWFLGGSFAHVGGVPRAHIAHVGPDHKVTAWNPGADGNVYAFAMSGNTVYAGGTFTRISGSDRVCLAALDLATAAVRPWNPRVNGGVVWSLALQDTVVFAAGQFTLVGTAPRSGLAAISARSGAALDWNAEFSGSVDVLRLYDSKLYVGGGFSSIGGKARSCAARLDPWTGLADDWNPDPDRQVTGLEVSGATVFLAGYFTTVGGQPRARLAAVDSSGGAAGAWAPFFDSTVKVFGVSGSKVIVGTAANFTFEPSPWGLAAFDATTGEQVWDAHVTGLVLSLAIADGIVYVGGNLIQVGGVERNHIAAFDATAGWATDWNPNADGQVNVIRPAGSNVFVGGSFSHVGGQSRRHLAAIDATSGLSTGWNPNPDAAVLALTSDASRLFVGGKFTHIVDQPRDRLAAFDLDSGSLAAGWNPGADGFVRAMAIQGSTLLIGGSFGAVGGEPRGLVAAIDASTGGVTDWNPGVGGGTHPDVYALALRGEEVVVGGDFASVGGVTRPNLAAIQTATASVTLWNPGPRQTIYALDVQDTTVIVGGSEVLGRFDPTTGTSVNWYIDGPVYAVGMGTSNLYAGGAFTWCDGTRHAGVTAIGSGDDTTPALLSLFRATTGADGVTLRWAFSPAASNAEVWPERGEGFGQSWERVAGESRDEGNIRVVTDHDARPGTAYRYRLVATLPDGKRIVLETIEARVPDAALGFSLDRVSPNPSSRSAVIEYTLPADSPVLIQVLDLQGRVVTTLLDAVRSAGRYRTVWRTSEGWPETSGVYFVRVRAAGRALWRRVIVAR